MVSRVIKESDAEVFSEIVYSLASGGIIIAPSETCYGLLADATDKKAVAKIFKLKKRSKVKSVSIFVSDMGMLTDYAIITKKAEEIISKYLPGPVTVVLKKRKPFKLAGNLSKGNTLAIRISSHPFIQNLLYNYGKPLTATSANLSGKAEIYSAKDAIKFGKHAGIVVDAGNLRKTKPSTVIDCTGKEIKILRQGSVKIKIK